MAVTVTLDLPRAKKAHGNSPGMAIISGVLAFDGSYPTGGESVTDITKKFETCFRIICDNRLGYLFEWDKTNKKLLVYQTVDAVAGTRSEVTNTADLSALTGVSFIAVGLV